MKKKSLLLVFIVLLFSLNLSAKVWRVSTKAGVDADYSNFADAHNSSFVAAGDTIYIEAGTATFPSISITKKLIIIGTGYFLADNPETQADLEYPTFYNITFASGSEGSIIKGCKIGKIIISTSNIVIENNYIHNTSTSATSLVSIGSSISNIILRKNYMYFEIYDYNYTRNAISAGDVNNLIIENNFIYADNTYSSYYAIPLSVISGTIKNNVIYGYKCKVSNAVFNNNIIVYGSGYTFTNTDMNNNLCNYNQCGIENGNQANVDMANVFENYTGDFETDNKIVLKSGSIAAGAGVDGVDCGVFGGDDPYILSGLPNIPAIYFYQQTIDNTNQEIQITIKAKSHE